MSQSPQPLNKSRGAVTRVRASRACRLCHQQKRKCDGKQPCGLCLKAKIACEYGWRQSNVNRSPVQPDAIPTTITSLSTSSDGSPQDHPSHASRREATSGLIFSESFASSREAHDRSGVRWFAWNTGLRRTLCDATPSSVESLLDWPTFKQLSTAYFELVHEPYGFLYEDEFLNLAHSRFLEPGVCQGRNIDAIICLVCALGCLFTSFHWVKLEMSLYQTAKGIIDSLLEETEPTGALVVANTLRTTYLRATKDPHSAWLSSCQSMHLMESASSSTRDFMPIPETRTFYDANRLFWMTRLLNTFISFEYGTSQVTTQVLGELAHTMSTQGSTCIMVAFYNYSSCLDPAHEATALTLETVLTQVYETKPLNVAVALSRTILFFAVYRRLRIVKQDLNLEHDLRLVEIGTAGLDAVEEIMATTCAPWWHLASIPYHYLCLALLINTPNSLSVLPRILEAIRIIKEHFNTDSLRQVEECSLKLIRCVVAQKANQAASLDRLLPAHLRVYQHQAQANPHISQESDMYINPELECGVNEQLGLTLLYGGSQLAHGEFDFSEQPIWDLQINGAVPRQWDQASRD